MRREEADGRRDPTARDGGRAERRPAARLGEHEHEGSAPDCGDRPA